MPGCWVLDRGKYLQGGGARLLLVAGPWEVAVIFRWGKLHPQCLAVAAGRVHSQGSDSNNGWCLVAVPSSVMTSEVTGATGGVCSWTPSGGGPGPPLVSEVTAMVHPRL